MSLVSSVKKRRKYKIHYGRILSAFLLMLLLVTGMIFLAAFLFRSPQAPQFDEPNLSFTQVTAAVEGSPYYSDSFRSRRMAEAVGSIYSPYALLMEEDTGRVLYRKAENDIAYPASLTKMMTLILAIENLPDLSLKIKLPTAIFAPLYQMNASMAGFQPEESATVKDLLYGTMLPSGAECAIGLAEEISGSEEAFADLMNQKAAELGMNNTHFTNCTGLHDPNHYSTAKDMALLLKYCLRNETFRTLFDTASYRTEPTSVYADGIPLESTMFRKVKDPQIDGGGTLLGGKTGYTGEAGLCLASLAEVNGADYILVTMGAHGNNSTEPFHLLDAFNLYGHIQNYTSDD